MRITILAYMLTAIRIQIITASLFLAQMTARLVWPCSSKSHGFSPNSINGVQLVFFDAEDQGGINGQNWSQGAEAFVESFVNDPDAASLNAVVIIDMIGDADQQVYYEQASNTQLSQEIWGAAAALGYAHRIIPEVKHNIIDDHLPFIRAGFAAVDMIDIDYTYWHTVDDTPDKVSPESLETIGLTLLKWLAERK